MASQIWSGSLTFGLVNLPVSMVSAIRPGPATLRMLHAEDAEPLERRMHCPECDSDVPDSEQIRGFRVESGEFVEVTDDELESLAPERSQAIEIDCFVDLDEIDPLYFERPYFLLPDNGAEKSYCLLVDALVEKGRAGIAKFVLSASEHLVAVTARDDLLQLYTLKFARQVLSSEDLEPESANVSSERLNKLLDYIEDNTGEFDPADYPDEDDRRLLEFIRERAEESGVERSSRSRRKKALPRSKAEERIDEALDDIDAGDSRRSE